MDANGVCKVADFGTAQLFDTDDTLYNARGTYEFLAPECCNSERQQFSGRAADVWALGVTVYALIFSELPFQGEGVEAVHSIKKQA